MWNPELSAKTQSLIDRLAAEATVSLTAVDRPVLILASTGTWRVPAGQCVPVPWHTAIRLLRQFPDAVRLLEPPKG